MAQISHYTLNTGHGRLTDRSEVSEETIELLRPVVRAGGGRLPVGFRVVMSPGEAGGWLYTIYQREIPVATCGLARTEEQSREVWPYLVDLAERMVLPRPKRAPSVPWLSVVVLPTAGMIDRETLMATADLERCIAWTILEEGL